MAAVNNPTVDLLNNRATFKSRPRRSFNVVKQDRHALNLLLRAFDSFQRADPSDPLSYFQICGIHGVPRSVWDNAESQGDYCHHHTPLFASWHRPYVLLFEYALMTHANKVWEDEFKHHAESAEYGKAFADFSMPYWAWENVAFHDEFSDEKVTLPFYDAKANEWSDKEVHNPLLSYQVPANQWGGSFQSLWGAKSSPTFRSKTAAQRIARSQGYLQRLVRTFMQQSVWLDQHQQGASSSLEAPHDMMHGLIGGWMGRVDFAAFDPIFWLHHSNVERLLYIWQERHNDVWVNDNTAGNVDDFNGNTPLVPFSEKKDDTWTTLTSTRIRDATGMYTFEEDAAAAAAAAPAPQPPRTTEIVYKHTYRIFFPQLRRILDPAKTNKQGSYEIKVRVLDLQDASLDEDRVEDEKDPQVRAGAVTMFLRGHENAKFCANCKRNDATSPGTVELNEAMRAVLLAVKHKPSDDYLKSLFSKVIQLSGAFLEPDGQRTNFDPNNKDLRYRIAATPQLLMIDEDTNERRVIPLDLPQLRASASASAASSAASSASAK